MKQTAVEWIYKALLLDEDNPDYNEWVFNKAKAMEKEQIINAYDDGKSDGYKTAREWDEMVIFLNAEQYYNETFKSE